MSGGPETEEQRVAAVVRRALELEAAGLAAADGSRLPDETVADIAGSLGIDRGAVTVALAEERVRAVSRRALLDRVVGPSRIMANGPTSESEDEVRARIVDWLETGHGLRPRVTADGVVVAARRRDAVGKLAAGVRRARGLGGLSKVAEVQAAAVTPPGTDRGAVVVVADVADRRNSAIAGGSVVAVGGGAVIGLAAAVTAPVVLVTLPVAVGAGAVVARVSYRRSVRRTREAVEETVDRIVQGESPPSLLGSFRTGDRGG